jgi:Tol biopolymer transport system component
MIGRVLGPYQVVAKLGAGGMGEVYAARDTRLDRDVAIKVLPGALAADPEALARFEREARAVAALSHPNILAIHDFGTHEGTAFAVTERLEGETLRARLAAGALPPKKAAQIAADVARGLAAAHDKHIAHRDLKPENIFVTSDGQVKILDFGLAKQFVEADGGAPADDSPTDLHTDPGTVMGTVGYMAPEQVRGQPADPRADIFALGCILYEMATGQRAFQRDTVAETMTAILREDPPETSDGLHPVPPALDEVIRHCLEKRPEERFQSARDLSFALRALTGTQPTSGRAAAVAADDRAASARRSVLPIGAAVAASLVIGAAIGWWASRPAAADEPWSEFTQLTDEAGPEEAPSLSPDGTSVAYASRASGSWDIYVRRVGGRNATVVAGDPERDESAPAFSPDGRSIAFHEADADGGIFIVGATGESARRVTETGFHPAWSPDGGILAFCQEGVTNPAARQIKSALSVVDLASGAVRVLTEGDAVQPAWSPSGTRLAYWGQFGGQRDLFTISAAGGEPVQVTDDPPLDWSVTWAPDGWLYFSSDRGGAFNLWRVAVDEASGSARGEPVPVTMGVQAAAAMPGFSADGRHMVFRSRLDYVNPVAIPFDPETEQLGEPAYLFRRTGVFSPADVSSDGQWLLHDSVGGRVEDIFVSRVDGSELRRLTDDPHRDRAPVWSPDGSMVTFYSNRSGAYEVWSIRRDGSGLTKLSNRPDESIWFPFYEPSGNRIWAYLSRARSIGTFDATDPPTTQDGIEQPPIEVAGGTLRPHGISGDGERLVGVAVSADGTGFGVGWHDLGSGRTGVSTEHRSPGIPVWLPDGRRVVYSAPGRVLVLVDTRTGASRTLDQFEFDIGSVVVSPDGRTIFLAAVLSEADIWLAQRRTR